MSLRPQWKLVKVKDVLGHEIATHKVGTDICELADVFWSYFDIDKNETTYCCGKWMHTWNNPSRKDVARLKLDPNQLRKIFYTEFFVETEEKVMEVNDGEPWLMAFKGLPLSHYYVRENSGSQIWKEHKSQVVYKEGYEAGHTPKQIHEIPKDLKLIRRKAPKKSKEVKETPSVAAVVPG